MDKQTVKRSEEVISYSSRDEILWRTHGNVRAINGGGYDFVVKSDLNGFHYEDTCFDLIARRLLSDHIAIGPHLTDIIFSDNTTDYWRYQVRPDAMIFNRIDGYWELTMLAEIKSAYANGIERKLNGFSALLTQLRQEQWFLPKRLREYAGDIVRVPTQIRIPEDPDVDVLIAAPFPRGTGDHVSSTRFPIVYARVK